MAYEEAPVMAEGEGKPEIDPARADLVKKWIEKVKAGRKEREETFKEMRKSQDFAHYGCDKEWLEDGKYTVPILPRYINQAVSTLYAKNPKTVWKRKPRLMYRLWDGRSDSLQAAMEMAQMGDAQSMAILQEVIGVRQQDMMLDRMGETLNILWQYFLDEQGANYKQQLKAAVRRAKIVKVAWIGLQYQRALEPRPETVAAMNDVTSKIAQIEDALKDMQEEPGDMERKAEAEQLRLNLADLERDKDMVVREGPLLYFPRSDSIIVDPECTHLKSLTGAGWVAEEMERCEDEVEAIYKIDLEGKFQAYTDEGKETTDKKKSKARLWRVQDKTNQQVFVVCDGYPDFIKEPTSPDVWVERFWTLFPIVFNETDHYKEIYPKSDVEQAKHIQNEYNRSREALRQHRIASQPYWVDGSGMSEEEKLKMSARRPHAVISLPSLLSGEKVADKLQAGPTAPIDMNLYDTEQHFNDLLRVVGYQEAQMGATSGSTATESSIAQQSQSQSQADNIDDLDEVMSELARAAGQVMLLNMTKDIVMEIVGDGAVWPDTPETRSAAAKEITLEVESGSTGRPNQAAELANTERAAPWLTQLPGVNPKPIIQKYAQLLNISMEELYSEGVPSITAINSIMAKAAAGGGVGGQPTGDPTTDPNAQGGQGAQNAPNPQVNEPQAQPGYPGQAPMA